jgi:hypothetical protein
MRFYIRGGTQIFDGGVPVEIVSPYGEDEIHDIDYVQSGNVMYLVHKNHPPKRLIRTDDVTWTLVDIEFYDGPFFPENDKDGTGATASVTMTPSSAGVAVQVTSNPGIFVADDVGRQIRLLRAVDPGGGLPLEYYWASGKITAFNTIASVDVTFKQEFPLINDGQTNIWRFSEWNSQTGYPSTVDFYEERLVFGYTSGGLVKIAGSVPDDFINMSPSEHDGTVTEANAYTYVVASGSLDGPLWFAAQDALLVGTEDAIYAVSGSDRYSAITPISVNAKRQGAHGARKMEPLGVQNSHLFVSRTGRMVRQIAYNYGTDGYIAPDISFQAEHLLRNGVEHWTYAHEPYPLVWAATAEGELLGLSISEESELLAWHSHDVGGKVRSITAIPNDDCDEVWMVVERTIDGTDVLYVEYMGRIFEPSSTVSQEDSYYVDCGISYNGEATTLIAGLSHLESYNVDVLVNGATHPNVTVNGGQIALDFTGEVVHVGINNEAVVKMLPIDIVSEIGYTQYDERTVDKVYVDLYQSNAIKIRYEDGREDIPAVRSSFNPTDNPVSLYDGTIEALFDWHTDTKICPQVVQPWPLPLTIRAIGVIFTSE